MLHDLCDIVEVHASQVPRYCEAPMIKAVKLCASRSKYILVGHQYFSMQQANYLYYNTGQFI